MDKDPALDRLLERVAQPRGGVRSPDCLDAETLAAFVDNTLTPNGRAAAERHAADCDVCLSALAALAKMTPPPSEIEQSPWFSIRWLLPLGAAATIALAVVLVRNDVDVERATVPPPPAVAAPPPAAPAAPPQRDATAQSRAPSETLAKKQEVPRAPAAGPRVATRAPAAATEAARDDKRTIDAVAVAPKAPLPEMAQQSTAIAQSAAAFRSEAATPMIVSPDPNVRWRLAGTALQRSTDAGASWTALPTGTDAPLLAGAAPSANVCWIVGRAGTVLLTTDAATWQRMVFPDSNADLVFVAARDALSATVTTSDGRTYKTEDGGRTWVLQENSTAPF